MDAPAHAILRAAPPAALPPHSAFRTLEEAAAFLKYKPFGLSPHGERQASVVAITRDEAAWKSRLVTVAEADFAFFREKAVLPEICMEVAPIRYQWNRGRILS